MLSRDNKRNPLFIGEASPFALGTMLQLLGGSPYGFGGSGWLKFGQGLVRSLEEHIETAGLNHAIRDLAAVSEWAKTAEATVFFDKNIPAEGRRKEFIFI